MKPIIKIENVSKQYRLGLTGTGTFTHDVNRWWHSIRGKEDPYLKIGETNDRSVKGESDYVWALQNINFEVMPGEVLGIIGKNGAGKSTLLKLLSRVTAPTTGSIKARGRIASLLEVGTGFHPELTGRENVFLNGAIMGMTKPEIRAKFDEIVDFAGCERYIDTPVKRYSSGMYVRLAFAVAAHLEPDILVVDEVLAVGDAEFQKKAIGKMKDVSTQGGRTVLFVSHNMASIKSLCSRSILLHDGRVSLIGHTEDIISKYLEENTVRSEVLISERKDRKGNGIALLRGYKFIDQRTGAKIDSVVSGQSVKLILTFENMTNGIINDFEIGVGFYNKNEQLLFACNNSVLGKLFSLKQGLNEISIFLEKWPTSGGDYSFNVFSSRKGEINDWIQNAGRIFVDTGDFYGNGIVPASKSQSVFVSYDFQ